MLGEKAVAGFFSGGGAAVILASLHTALPAWLPFVVVGPSLPYDFVTGALGGSLAACLEHGFERWRRF